ncbi:MAG TPA: sigma 54-interacting transcriptional regulator [Thermoanaerobaculia bacterium]|nr:sigma 54-interacting transcriptional regulator [Thermoanaerobaculia bacterium]
MRMRGGSRRTTCVDARAFGWDHASLATLRHCSLPFDEPLPLAPLGDVGKRDRLSLLGQFAAHQALLQFAGIADGELDPAEWAIVQKRGCDVRLVRTAARACDPSDAPPVLTLAQQFAEHIGVELEILAQSWARADAIYAEAFARVTKDATADLRWLRQSACGSIASPGPEALRALGNGRFGATSDCADVVQRYAALDGRFKAVVLRGVSPLERYSALPVQDRDVAPAAVAERLLANTSQTRHVFIVADAHLFDEGSRQVVEILSRSGHGAWLIPDAENALPATKPFLVAPRIGARAALHMPFAAFVDTPAFATYLAHGEIPNTDAPLPELNEPLRSYIGALALLGNRVSSELAKTFLAEFLFHGDVDELLIDGVTHRDGEDIVFTSEELRTRAAKLVPSSIARVAATHTNGVDAALLWLDAGEPRCAAEVLEAAHWTLDDIRRVPRSAMNEVVRSRYAHMLIDAGRYRDARELAPFDEFVLARAERRMGDYATALMRLDRLPASFETTLLRAEVLRLLDRSDEAQGALDECTASNDEDRIRLDYERALHGAKVRLPDDHYLAARMRMDGVAAHQRARNTIERIDASLDRVFTTFTDGRWDEARAIAVEALQETEETQGDRAAGGILFTLAYLAADDGQWAHASLRIARLRHFYTSTRDTLRLAELHLLDAHLDFCRGRLADARRNAESVYAQRRIHDQIREAAALILDELDVMDGKRPTRATGSSGNVELTRRRERIHAGHTVKRAEVADPTPAEVELRALRAAATREFPFTPFDFDVPWCFATRNRLGQWSAIGSRAFDNGEGDDWIEVSDRDRLFIEGCGRWSAEGRDAVAAIFRMRAENHRLKRIAEQEENTRPVTGAIDGIVGNSAAIREVESLVARIAKRDVAVCILGESGTGKELVARAIHRQSPRRQKPFTPVNCAALPENLVESELFGHVRGAFTGADRDRAGLIETTDGGTLFLDEIGELPLATQAKLLRFLQEGEFRRVGDTQNRFADVRIVSATNRKLDAAVEEGRFREDLYYRVRGIEVVLPPLRERGADILLLAGHFLAVERERHESGPALLSTDAEAIFSAYSWPGNVRELQSTIRGAHAMAGEAKEIAVEHLPERLRAVAPSRAVAGSYQDAVTRFKRDLIETSLLHARGNQNRAAASLRISRQALAYQIRELGILVKS